MKWFPSWILVISCFIHGCYSWDTDDYELFDLVEEVNTNFYTLLGVPQDANAVDIKRAYRKLSLILHPDKNDAPDAEIKFRQLVAVYDVLRDSNKRLRYNLVLQNGLPDWRHVAYYYRRVRKMGLAEMSLILFIIVTIGQYVVAWAAYLEKKYTLEQLWEAKLKKLQKKQRKGKYDGPAIPETVPLQIPTPRVWDTLPFQLPRFLWFIVTLCPHTVTYIYDYVYNRRQNEESEQWSEEEEEFVEVEHKGPRRRKGKQISPPEVNSSWEPTYSSKKEDQIHSVSMDNPAPVSGGLWTDDDLSELIRLVKKYPPGSAGRWEKISQLMQRPVAEVTHMAKKVKEDGYRMVRPSDDCAIATETEVEKPRKVKTRVTKEDDTNSSDVDMWSQPQQKALEAALTKYPKGGAGDRWEKIAKCVPGKSKEECMQRYRHLVEVVKRKKETTDGVSTSENTDA